MMKEEKRLSIFAISVQNLRARKLRTGFMVFFVFLLSFTFFAGSILMDSMKRGIESTTDKMGSDLIVVPEQESGRLQESFFAGEPCTIYFDKEWLGKIQDIKGIKRATPQLYLATMASSCCDAPVQLIAFDPETDFIVQPWLEKQGDLQLKTGQVVVGYNIAAETGEKVKFYDTEFTVAAKLEKTGMGYDDSAFMNFDTIYALKDSDKANENLKLEQGENLISMVLADVSKESSAVRVRSEIRLEYAKDDILVCSANELMTGLSAGIEKFASYGNVTVALLFLATEMALLSVFTITIHERKCEFGIMYTMGARRGQMWAMIVSEAVIISVLGGILGIAVSGGLLFTFHNLIAIKLDIPYFNVAIGEMSLVAGKCLLISILTGLAASAYSAYQISKEEPYKLIRENE